MESAERLETTGAVWFRERDEEASLRPVAYSVSATMDCRGERSCTSAMGVHEFVVARRRYRNLSGDIEFLPSWPKKVKRARPLNHEQYTTHREYLQNAYVERLQSGEVNIAEQVYGPGLEKLQGRMNKAFERFCEIAKKQSESGGVTRIEITPEQWEELCDICDPTYRSMRTPADADFIEVEDIEASILRAEQERRELDMQRAAEEADGAVNPDGTAATEDRTISACVASLRSQIEGLTDDEATQAATILAAAAWSNPANLDLSKVPGCSNSKAKTAVIREALAAYLDDTDPAPMG